MPVFEKGQVRYGYLQFLQDSFHTSVVTCNKEQNFEKESQSGFHSVTELSILCFDYQCQVLFTNLSVIIKNNILLGLIRFHRFPDLTHMTL